MANVDAALEQQVFHIPKRQREPNVHQHCQADHLRRGVEIAEWTGRLLGTRHDLALANLQPHASRCICSDNAVASASYSYTAGTNRLASLTDSSGTRSISYDDRGNTLSESRPGGTAVAATYDGYGRLLTYDRTGDPSQANAYNGLDDRVSADSGGTTHSWHCQTNAAALARIKFSQ
jgi:YD repeat-containing protein